jgi:benzoyl-CoA reductase/2-hydroxyglutaryl-CoA dehydratase subunit BcrC/BadD/HgdB
MIGALRELLNERPESLAKAKEEGAKVVGYFCPYVPVELIRAAGLIPLRLIHGGESEAAEAGEQFLGPSSCPYARACLGNRVLDKDPYYASVDALCVAPTCDSMKRVQDYWQYYFKVPVFSIGVPRTYDRFRMRPHALGYLEREFGLLKTKLERWTGKPITRRQLKDSIKLYNSIRMLMRELYDRPKGRSPEIGWSDAFEISQMGFLLDPQEFLAELQRIHETYQLTDAFERGAEKEGGVDSEGRVRLMIYGSHVALGDRKVMEIIDGAGGDVVADALCTGSKFWRKDVSTSGNPIRALAERYISNINCPFMMDMNRRISYVTKVAREYGVKGLIYYNLRYCESYRSELRLFEETLKKETGIPLLLIETEYSPSDIGTIRTKVEAFLEMIRGVYI